MFACCVADVNFLLVIFLLWLILEVTFLLKMGLFPC